MAHCAPAKPVPRRSLDIVRDQPVVLGGQLGKPGVEGLAVSVKAHMSATGSYCRHRFAHCLWPTQDRVRIVPSVTSTDDLIPPKGHVIKTDVQSFFKFLNHVAKVKAFTIANVGNTLASETHAVPPVASTNPTRNAWPAHCSRRPLAVTIRAPMPVPFVDADEIRFRLPHLTDRNISVFPYAQAYTSVTPLALRLKLGHEEGGVVTAQIEPTLAVIEIHPHH